MDEEREQLAQRVKKLEERLQRGPNFEELYSVTSQLRQEQEEEARLAERLQEQTIYLEQSRERVDHVMHRRKEVGMTTLKCASLD